MALEDEAAKRELAEKALERQRQELISIFDSIDEVIYVCDPVSYELLYVNAAAKAVFGPDIVGQKCYETFQGLDEPCEVCTNPMILGREPGKLLCVAIPKQGEWAMVPLHRQSHRMA